MHLCWKVNVCLVGAMNQGGVSITAVSLWDFICPAWKQSQVGTSTDGWTPATAH